MVRDGLSAAGAEVLRQVRIEPTFAVDTKKLDPRLADGQPANVVAHQESELGQISSLIIVRGCHLFFKRLRRAEKIKVELILRHARLPGC